MALRSNRSRRLQGDYWPGFVDALTGLLLVTMFMLSVFMLAQFFLSEAISGRDTELQKLSREIAELSDLLAIEQDTSDDLTNQLSDLTASLAAVSTERDRAITSFQQAENERLRVARLLDETGAELAAVSDKADTLSVERERLLSVITGLEERNTIASSEIASLSAALTAATTRQKVSEDERQKIAAQLAALEQEIELSKQERDELLRKIEDVRLRALAVQNEIENQAELAEEERERMVKALEDLRLQRLAEEQKLAEQQALSDEERAEMAQALREAQMRERLAQAERDQLTGALTDAERTALVEVEARRRLEALLAKGNKDLSGLTAKLNSQSDAAAAAEAALVAEKEISSEAQNLILLLNQQVAALRQQLAGIQDALEVSESEGSDAQLKIEDLGRRLNAALATKVGELEKYRSEFFGRLRDILGNRQGIEVRGDRFVFQSEVLFASGSADLGPAGQNQLDQLADILVELSGEIPSDVDWILRIDGHTDRAPINTPEFPSNWELSAARAISVVKFLRDRGIPQRRLAATGFGQYQPLDQNSDADAYSRNRRIELKFTER